jgi:hypothetical protein
MGEIMSEELAKYEAPEIERRQTMAESFKEAWDIACAFAQSDVIPESYRGKPANCVIAMDMSKRLGVSITAVMQSLYIVHGKPSWSSQFIIAAVNGCGRFSTLRYELQGQGPSLSCFAWAKELQSGESVKGPTVTMEMAQKEGWVSKKGSKWQTMPELMIQYRAATFFGRLYCPDILMGMHTVEENMDIANSVAPRVKNATSKLLGEQEEPVGIDYNAAMGETNA